MCFDFQAVKSSIKKFKRVRGGLEMALLTVMKGEPLVTKLAALAKYAVLPGTMIAALIYSPPNYAYSKKPQSSPTSN